MNINSRKTDTEWEVHHHGQGSRGQLQGIVDDTEDSSDK